MAEWRSVKVNMWAQDEWFMDLPTAGKLLWIYLFTNAHASVAGIYRLPLRTMAFESGLDPRDVEHLLEAFERDGKAMYRDGVIWVVKMREHQSSNSIKVQTRMDRDFADIPSDNPIKGIYAKKYGIDMVSVGYPQVAADTETETHTETETENDTDTERKEPSLVTKEQSATNGHSSTDPVDFSLSFLSLISFDDPEPFLNAVDPVLVAQWGWYYQHMNEQQRKGVRNWPAMINKKCRNSEAPRLSDRQKTAFYRMLEGKAA